MSTANARQWTTPVIAFSVHSHDAVSPSLIIERDRTAKIWYLKSGVAGCNAETTTLQLRTARPGLTDDFESVHWSAPVATDLAIPGYVPWHIDVAELPLGGYVALIAAFPRGNSCSQSDLWLATSDDARLSMTHGPASARGMGIRRSARSRPGIEARAYDPATDVLDIWPSAPRAPPDHHCRSTSEITDMMASAKASDMRAVAVASRGCRA